MVNVNAVPAKNTDFQLLVALVPDFEYRLETIRKKDPDLFEEIRRRAMDTEEGWKPLDLWREAP